MDGIVLLPLMTLRSTVFDQASCFSLGTNIVNTRWLCKSTRDIWPRDIFEVYVPELLVQRPRLS